jgi:hypothetical protein
VSTSVGDDPSGTPNASASEWAGSVESTRVLRPREAARAAVAAEAVVFPTPPLPVNSRTRKTNSEGEKGKTLAVRQSDSTLFLSSFKAESMIIFSAFRLNIPSIGMAMSTVSLYVTSVVLPLSARV